MSFLPPKTIPTPAWARAALSAAKSRNGAMGYKGPAYSIDDLTHAWNLSGGRCAVSGLEFDNRRCGNGQAKHPFAPSMDRENADGYYTRDNVRLVVAVANFGMNAWGLGPLHELASAIHRLRGDFPATTPGAPTDAVLDPTAIIDQEFIETDQGIVAFPPRADIEQAILELLSEGSQSSRQLEDRVAERFDVTRDMREAMATGRYPVWRNQVAWALVDLGVGKRGSGQIERIETQVAPDGGKMGLYRLVIGKKC
jgi:hypothetical protein